MWIFKVTTCSFFLYYIFSFFLFNIDETVTEEKVVEYVEDEIFSSSRRTSATASSDKAQASLKPQAVEKDPASNYHPYEDKNEESKDHARNNGESAKETKSSRPSQENSQYPQRITTTTPEPTTSNPFQARQSTTGEKSNPIVDSIESSSEDPLYASDEHAKVCISIFFFNMNIWNLSILKEGRCKIFTKTNW